jgi:NAD(P)-dependent dehydrogenase (short-subunit alcohol dehydrogenase family)
MALLNGSVAVVTGGSRGIGRAIAAGVPVANARAVINGRSDAAGRQA